MRWIEDALHNGRDSSGNAVVSLKQLRDTLKSQNGSIRRGDRGKGREGRGGNKSIGKRRKVGRERFGGSIKGVERGGANQEVVLKEG